MNPSTTVSDAPRISVITVSRGRPDALISKAKSLQTQILPSHAFEWCIYLNESADEVERVRARLEKLGLRFKVHVAGGEVHPIGRGRNEAASRATAPILLISDDDVTHSAGALEAHLAFHDAVSDAVGVGPLRLPEALRDGQRTEPFERTTSAFGRIPWIQMTGTNTSLRKIDFDAVGGYDPNWDGYGGEDPELALRLVVRGLTFRRVEHAVAEHHGRVWDNTEKAYEAGKAHVRVVRRHPQAASAWWLGVHPILLAVKRVIHHGPWSSLFDSAVLAYERAYAQGARDAWRQRAAQETSS